MRALRHPVQAHHARGPYATAAVCRDRSRVAKPGCGLLVPNPLWFPLGHAITLAQLDVDNTPVVVLSCENDVVLLAQRFRWQPSEVMAMPTSVRRRYVRVVLGMNDYEYRKQIKDKSVS